MRSLGWHAKITDSRPAAFAVRHDSHSTYDFTGRKYIIGKSRMCLQREHMNIRSKLLLSAGLTSDPAQIIIALALCVLAAGCGTVRLPTPEEMDASLAKSAEGHNLRECQRKNVDARDYFACKQQNKQAYEQWQKERDNAK